VEREQETRFEVSQTREQIKSNRPGCRTRNRSPASRPQELAASASGVALAEMERLARNSCGILLRGHHFRAGGPPSYGLLFAFTGLAASMRLRTLALTTSFIGEQIRCSWGRIVGRKAKMRFGAV